jgi:hypothetical protein
MATSNLPRTFVLCEVLTPAVTCSLAGDNVDCDMAVVTTPLVINAVEMLRMKSTLVVKPLVTLVTFVPYDELIVDADDMTAVVKEATEMDPDVVGLVLMTAVACVTSAAVVVPDAAVTDVDAVFELKRLDATSTVVTVMCAVVVGIPLLGVDDVEDSNGLNGGEESEEIDSSGVELEVAGDVKSANEVSSV